ncbi:MAG: zinc metalloprotease HtpX, partial [Bacteroidota bacterium]
MTRILLFVATNVAVMALIGIVFQLLGIQGLLAENGVDLNLQAVMVMSLLIGFSGSIISLMMSKSMARRSMGVHIIEQPANQGERWLVETVYSQADRAGIGRPEVGIFDSPQPNAFATGANRNNAL